MGAQRVWSPITRKVDAVAEMVWHLFAGFITLEVTLQNLTFMLESYKQ